MVLRRSAVAAHNTTHVVFAEKLVHESSVPKEANSLEEDLPKLQSILENRLPSYVLVRQDGDGNGWLFISYVPDDATVRDKVRVDNMRLPSLS